MSARGILLIAVVTLGVATLLFYFAQRGDSDPPQPTAEIDAGYSSEGESLNAVRIEPPADSGDGSAGTQEYDPDNPATEPVEVINWRTERGYYQTFSNDPNAKHPYELYDTETLEALADQGDSLAQLILADKLFINDPDRADSLYLLAAVGGKTAALINMASNRLIAVPGGTGFGFPLYDESGDISQSYASVLGYYAAAEYLGDFVGTDLLQAHLVSSGLMASPQSIKSICDIGSALNEKILDSTSEQQNALFQANNTFASFDVPAPICRGK